MVKEKPSFADDGRDNLCKYCESRSGSFSKSQKQQKNNNKRKPKLPRYLAIAPPGRHPKTLDHRDTYKSMFIAALCVCVQQ